MFLLLDSPALLRFGRPGVQSDVKHEGGAGGGNCAVVQLIFLVNEVCFNYCYFEFISRCFEESAMNNIVMMSGMGAGDG